MTQHVFDKAENKGTPENHIIHMNMSQSTQWCATVPFSSQWGKPCTVTSTLHRLHWPLGGRGPLLWAPPRAVREEGEGGKKLMPWFQMSGLVNMPRTVVKDGNENGRLPGCTAQWIHFPICIYGGGREGMGREAKGEFWWQLSRWTFLISHRQAGAFKNVAVFKSFNPSTA